MGWAKYYEDNVSICIGRMAMRESEPTFQNFKADRKSMVTRVEPQIKNMEYHSIFTRHRQNGRRGLELIFQKPPGPLVLRKLQMNGWWWSKGNVCWCNSDTTANRRYVEDSLRTFDPSLSVVEYCD